MFKMDIEKKGNQKLLFETFNNKFVFLFWCYHYIPINALRFCSYNLKQARVLTNCYFRLRILNFVVNYGVFGHETPIGVGHKARKNPFSTVQPFKVPILWSIPFCSCS